MKQNWIPITEERPDQDKIVMVRLLDNMDFNTDFTFEQNGERFFCCSNGERGKIITHWKPMTRLASFMLGVWKHLSNAKFIKIHDGFLDMAPPEVREWLESEVEVQE